MIIKNIFFVAMTYLGNVTFCYAAQPATAGDVMQGIVAPDLLISGPKTTRKDFCILWQARRIDHFGEIALVQKKGNDLFLLVTDYSGRPKRFARNKFMAIVDPDDPSRVAVSARQAWSFGHSFEDGLPSIDISYSKSPDDSPSIEWSFSAIVQSFLQTGFAITRNSQSDRFILKKLAEETIICTAADSDGTRHFNKMLVDKVEAESSFELLDAKSAELLDLSHVSDAMIRGSKTEISEFSTAKMFEAVSKPNGINPTGGSSKAEVQLGSIVPSALVAAYAVIGNELDDVEQVEGIALANTSDDDARLSIIESSLARRKALNGLLDRVAKDKMDLLEVETQVRKMASFPVELCKFLPGKQLVDYATDCADRPMFRPVYRPFRAEISGDIAGVDSLVASNSISPQCASDCCKLFLDEEEAKWKLLQCLIVTQKKVEDLQPIVDDFYQELNNRRLKIQTDQVQIAAMESSRKDSLSRFELLRQKQ